MNREPFVMLPLWAIDRINTATTCGVAWPVYTALLRRRNRRTGQCNPSINRILKDLGGRGTRNSVCKAIKELEAAGVIERRRTNRSNTYIFPEAPPPDVPQNDTPSGDSDVSKTRTSKPATEELDVPQNDTPGCTANEDARMYRFAGHKPEVLEPDLSKPESGGSSSSLEANQLHTSAPLRAAKHKAGNFGNLHPNDDDRTKETRIELLQRYPDSLDGQRVIDRLHADYGVSTGRTVKIARSPLFTFELIRETLLRYEIEYASTIAKNQGGYVGNMLEDAVACAKAELDAARKSVVAEQQQRMEIIGSTLDGIPDDLLIEIHNVACPALASPDLTAETVRKYPIHRKAVVRYLLNHPEELSAITSGVDA